MSFFERSYSSINGIISAVIQNTEYRILNTEYWER